MKSAQVQGKKLHFLSKAYGASMHDIEIPAQNSMHTMERLYSPIEKMPPFSNHPAQQYWCFDYENNNKLTEWPLKMCVRKFRMHYILNEQFLLNIAWAMSKIVRRELTFLVECISLTLS